MAITMHEEATAFLGREATSMADTDEAGLPFFAGCEGCGASLGSHNASPSRTGDIPCRRCLGALGFHDVDEFELDSLAFPYTELIGFEEFSP